MTFTVSKNFKTVIGFLILSGLLLISNEGFAEKRGGRVVTPTRPSDSSRVNSTNGRTAAERARDSDPSKDTTKAPDTSPNSAADVLKGAGGSVDTSGTKGDHDGDDTDVAKPKTKAELLREKAAAKKAAGVGAGGRAVDDGQGKISDAEVAEATKVYNDLDVKQLITELTANKGDNGLRAIFDPDTKFNQNKVVTDNKGLLDDVAKTRPEPEQAALKIALTESLLRVSKVSGEKQATELAELKEFSKKLNEAMGRAKTEEEKAELVRFAISALAVYGPHRKTDNGSPLEAKEHFDTATKLLEAYTKSDADPKTKEAFLGLTEEIEALAKSYYAKIEKAAAVDKTNIDTGKIWDEANADHNKWLIGRLIENGVKPEDAKKMVPATFCKCDGTCEPGKH